MTINVRLGVLIVEPDSNGHHANYLGLAAQGFVSAGLQVTVAADLANAAIHAELAGRDWRGVSFIAASKRTISNNDLGIVHDQIHYWRQCRELIRAQRSAGWRGDVFMPYLDRLIHAIGLLGSPDPAGSVSGILMRPQFGARQAGASHKSRLRRRLLTALFRRAVERRQVERIYVIDALTEADVRGVSPSMAQRVVRLVDPADCFRSQSREAARAQLGLPQDRFLILVYGEIAARKAAAELIGALSLRPGFAQAVVVGRSGADLGDSLVQAADGDAKKLATLMIRIDLRVSNDEERQFFEAADAVWVAYHDHPGMSGVLVQAGQMALPVIGCEAGAIGRYCREQRLGLTVEPHRRESILAALDQIASDRAGFAAMGSRGHATFSSFTRARFIEQIGESLTEAEG